jgi:ABC-type polysaccharide/polyol phosphate export permease
MNPSQTKPIYDSAKSPGPAIEELRAVILHRDLLGQLVNRDIVARYKRSVLGVLWTMLNPLGTMVILSIVFSQMFDMRGVYPAYIITTLVAWNFFSQTTTFSLNTTLWGSSLFQKIYIPRTSFVISTAGTGIVNLLFALVPLTLILIITGVGVHPSMIALPASILVMTSFVLGFSLLLSTLVVFFPDVNEFFPVVLTGWFYLTPIIYPEELLQDVLGGWILRLNPLYHLIKIFVLILYEGVLPTSQEWIVAIMIGVTTLIAGWIYFTRSSKKFGYYV